MGVSYQHGRSSPPKISHGKHMIGALYTYRPRQKKSNFQNLLMNLVSVKICDRVRYKAKYSNLLESGLIFYSPYKSTHPNVYVLIISHPFNSEIHMALLAEWLNYQMVEKLYPATLVGIQATCKEIDSYLLFHVMKKIICCLSFFFKSKLMSIFLSHINFDNADFSRSMDSIKKSIWQSMCSAKA